MELRINRVRIKRSRPVIYIWKILFYYVTLDYVSSSTIGGMWKTVMNHASRVFIPSFRVILSVSRYATDWCHRSSHESRLGLIHLIEYIEKCFNKYIFCIWSNIRHTAGNMPHTWVLSHNYNDQIPNAQNTHQRILATRKININTWIPVITVVSFCL